MLDKGKPLPIPCTHDHKNHTHMTTVCDQPPTGGSEGATDVSPRKPSEDEEADAEAKGKPSTAVARRPSRKPRTPPRRGAKSATTPAEPRANSNRKYDWLALRTIYVEGVEQSDGAVKLLSLKEIAEEYKINYETLRQRSSRERWPDRKQTYQSGIAAERQKKRIQQLGQESADFDLSGFQVAKLGMAMVTTRLAEVARHSKAMEGHRAEAMERLVRGDPVDKSELFSAIYHRELEGLASAADRFQMIGMRSLGTDVQRMEVTSPDGSMAGTTVNIHAEMTRDDPDRLVELLKAVGDSGLLEAVLSGQGLGDVIDGDVIEDAEEVDNSDQGNTTPDGAPTE